MSRTTVVLLLTSLFVSSCDTGVASGSSPRPWSVELAGETGVPRAHSWDGISSVPWPAGRDARSIVYGETGRTPRTGLYLTFEGTALADELALQPEGWEVEARALTAGEGRFGRGVELAHDSRLRCALPEAGREPPTWTIECWLRPGKLENAQLFALPGFLHVSTDQLGRVIVRVPGAGKDPLPEGGFVDIQVFTKVALIAGEWNHLGVVLDLRELRAVRMVLNGAVIGQRFELEKVSGRPEELVLGDVRGDGNGIAATIDELRIEQRNLSTADLAERWQAKPGPLERLELEYADGTRAELDVWTEPLRDAWISSPEQWARGELVHAVGGADGLAWTSESWRRVRTPEGPLARTTHSTASIGDRRVLVYGGETRDTHFGKIVNTDDTWIFDGATELWSRVPTTLAPSSRCHVPMAYSPDHGIVLLVGGWWNEVPPGVSYGDTWAYRIDRGDWELRSSEGLTPKETMDQVLVYLPSARRFLFMLGTGNFTYDPEADRWESLPPARIVDEHGNPAVDPPRYSRSAAVDARGQVFLYGGYRPEQFLDTTAIFDLASNTITVLDPEVRPPARVRSAFAYDPVRDRVVMFGGVRDQFGPRFDDLWVFDMATRTWRELPRGQGRPPARGGYYGMEYDAVADRFVVPCGRHSLERFLDETWILELDERPGLARHLIDRGGSRSTRWQAEVDAPGDARVAFRFRGSDDALHLGEWAPEPPPGARYIEIETQLVPGSRGEVPRVRAMGFR